MSETITPEQHAEYQSFKQLIDEYEDTKELAASVTDPILKEDYDRQLAELQEKIQKISPGFIDLEMAEEADKLNRGLHERKHQAD